MSQRVVIVESSSLLHHSLFIEFKTLDEVGDLDASRTANSAVTPRRKMRVKVGAP